LLLQPATINIFKAAVASMLHSPERKICEFAFPTQLQSPTSR